MEVVQLETPHGRTLSNNGNDHSNWYSNNFIEIKSLGSGGFGVVFEAKHKIDCQRYAVKKIKFPKQ